MSGTPPFVRHTGRVATLDRANVDTDQIIPKQFLKRIERDGFGEFLFWEWRKDPGFELNRPEYAGATILAAGPNFGSGSSREHAAWALEGAGFRAVVAPSFGDIFRINAGKTGLLAVALPEEDVRELMALAPAGATVDLERQTVTLASEREVPFAVDPDLRERLLNGWDEIDLTLRREGEITAYEQARERPGPSTLLLG
jgi:3-isopropylmalate/(R)-2-methylmalate dehydratase small subunit